MFLILKNHGGINALIGLDFFRHYRVTIDYSGFGFAPKPHKEAISFAIPHVFEAESSYLFDRF